MADLRITLVAESEGEALVQIGLLLLCAFLLVRLELLLRQLYQRIAVISAEHAAVTGASDSGNARVEQTAGAWLSPVRTPRDDNARLFDGQLLAAPRTEPPSATVAPAAAEASTLCADNMEKLSAENCRPESLELLAQAPPGTVDLLVGFVPPRLVRMPELNAEMRAGADELGVRITALGLVDADTSSLPESDAPASRPDPAGPFSTSSKAAAAAFLAEPTTLARYIVARARGVGAASRPDVAASFQLLEASLRWRLHTHPDSPPDSAMRARAARGSCYVAGLDIHGRPVLVLDNDKVAHVGEMDEQLACLAFHLEYCTRLLRSRPSAVNGVTRFLIFIKLGDYKLSTSPPVRTTIATVRLLLQNHPDRLGQAVLFQPPRLFSPLWAAASAVLPADTLAKVAFVSGDTSAGSANDLLLSHVVGPRWRELTGAEMPVLAAGCSPGFHIDAYWPMVERDYAQMARGEQPVGPDWPMAVPPADSAGGRSDVQDE